MTETSKPVLRKTAKIIPEISGGQNAKTLLFSRVFVAFEKGFEPPTPALGGRCSVLLSYSNKSRFFLIIQYHFWFDKQVTKHIAKNKNFKNNTNIFIHCVKPQYIVYYLPSNHYIS